MAEFEIGGMTFRGGKMMIVLTALSTLGGSEGYFDLKYQKLVFLIHINLNSICS